VLAANATAFMVAPIAIALDTISKDGDILFDVLAAIIFRGVFMAILG
jgi:hypothetical protein